MYMSPEQARGELEQLDTRSDIYALGAILYEILSLAPPIEGNETDMVLYRAARGEFRKPSERTRAPWPIPRELEAMVLKAMAYKPRARYRTVRELKAEIEAYLSGRTLLAASYSPWEVLAKWARRHKVALAGTLATALAIVLGLAAVIAVRIATGRQKDAESAAAAVRAYEKGTTLWLEAEGIPFQRANPHAWFKGHLEALLWLGQGLSSNPDPPEHWRSEVDAKARALTEKAQELDNWSLALVLSASPRAWGAIDEREAEARAQTVEDELARAVAADKARLDEILERLGSLDRGEKGHGKFVPGEIEERAVRLARRSRPEILVEILASLARGGLTTSQIELGAEVVGRWGDARIEAEGVRAPDVIRAGLVRSAERPAGQGGPPSDEIASWVRAAARLEARSPGALPDLPALLGRVKDARGNDAVVSIALGFKSTIAASGTGDPFPDGEGAVEWLEELSDWAAARARNRGEYTRYLLDRAENPDLSGRQRAFVYDQLGLAGDPLPPDPARLDRSAVSILRTALESSFRAARKDGGWLARDGEAAIKAAINLSRLSDRGSTGTGRGNALAAQGDLAGAIEDYTRAIALDPNLAVAHWNRGIARQAQGDLAGAIEDYTRAIALDPDRAAAYYNRGIVRKDQGDLAGAIEDYTRAIALDPNDPAAYGNRGIARQAQGDLAGAIEDYSRALELAPGASWALSARELLAEAEKALRER